MNGQHRSRKQGRPHSGQRIVTQLPFRLPFLPLVMSLVEKGAEGFGYTRREGDGLVLAMEELFSFYVSQASAEAIIGIDLEDLGYCLALMLRFRTANPDLRAFNLSWSCNLDNEESLAMLGPMIAARSVSSLRLELGADEEVVLRVTRNREYPLAPAVDLPPATPGGRLRLLDPSGEDLRHFVAMAVSAGCSFLPPFLSLPGMAADMLANGHLNGLLVIQEQWIRGGVFWRPLTDTCLELYGPYLFGDDPDDQGLALLLDEAVARISRSAYRGLVRRQGPLPGFARFFDFLGELHLQDSQGPCHCYYRQLQEETSGIVYCGEPLDSFLRSEYERLCLPRQIRQSGVDPRRLREHSVLTVELEHARSLAILRPLCAGQDMTANLRAHLTLLRDEGINNFLVELQTGRSEDMAFAPALAETGFMPRLVIPDAGQGDLVVYDYAPAGAGA